MCFWWALSEELDGSRWGTCVGHCGKWCALYFSPWSCSHIGFQLMTRYHVPVSLFSSLTFCFICSEALKLGTNIYNCEVLANILLFSSGKVIWPLGAFFVLFCLIVTVCVNVLDISMHDFPSYYSSDWSFLLDQLIGLSIFKIEERLYLLFFFFSNLVLSFPSEFFT